MGGEGKNMNMKKVHSLYDNAVKKYKSVDLDGYTECFCGC